MAAVKTFTFRKNVKGSLGIPLETYDMMGARKVFYFGYNIDSIVIPYPYALGLFVTNEAMDMFEQGYFTVDNLEDLYKAGIEAGFVAAESHPEVAMIVDIEDAVKNNKKVALKNIIKKYPGPVTINQILACARDNFDVLNNEMVEVINEATGVDIRIE